MKKYFFLILLIALHLFLLVNLRFTAWPEMLSYAYLRNNGFLIYKDMIHPYPPILTMILSFIFNLFGYKEIVLKIFTWAVVLASDYLIFHLILKLTKNLKLSFFGVMFYVILQPFLEGNQLWFDLFIVPFILSGLIYLLSERTNKNLFISGIFFGIAIFIKQTTGLFLVFIPIYLLTKKVELKRLFIFVLPTIIIFSVLVVRLITENALLDFFRWTLINPLSSWGKFPGYVQMMISNKNIFVLIALNSQLLFLIIKKRAEIFRDENTKILLLSLLISGILVYPRFSFFHLQLFIAVAAVLTFYLVSKIKHNYLYTSLYFFLLIIFISIPILKRDWGGETRFWENQDLNLAQIISRETEDSQNVYLLGLSSSLYVYTNKIPPKRWGDNFGWYYMNKTDELDMITRWQQNPPKYVVWKEKMDGNWFDLGVYQPPLVVEWINTNYRNTQKIEDGISLWEKVN